MSPTAGAPEPVLSAEQQEVWFAYMRVALRLTYEMNSQLQRDSDLSLPDFHVLNALADSPGERSRLSHHLQRMADRGLVERVPSATDRRATDAVLTGAGRAAVAAAAPAHGAFVRTAFFDGLDPALLPSLRTALEQVHEQVLAHGTLPRPGQPQRRLPGLTPPA
jgi:DNA-binding MarR family transcriptional regulator